jgi:hypothetical protein
MTYLPDADFDDNNQQIYDRLNQLRQDIQRQRALVLEFLKNLEHNTLSVSDMPPAGYERLHQMALTLQHLDALAKQNEALLMQNKTQSESMQANIQHIYNEFLMIKNNLKAIDIQGIITNHGQQMQKLSNVQTLVLLVVLLTVFIGILVFALTQNSNVEQTITSLDQTLGAAQLSQNTAQARDATLENRVNVLDSQLLTAEPTIVALMTGITNLISNIPQITPDPQIDLLLAEVTALVADIQTLRQTDAATALHMMQRIDALNATISILQTEQVNLQVTPTPIPPTATALISPTPTPDYPALEARVQTLEAIVTSLAYSQLPQEIVPAETTATVPAETTATVPAETTATVPAETTATVPAESTDNPDLVRVRYITSALIRQRPAQDSNSIPNVMAGNYRILGYYDNTSTAGQLWFCIDVNGSAGWLRSNSGLAVSFDGGQTFRDTISDSQTIDRLKRLLPDLPSQCEIK